MPALDERAEDEQRAPPPRFEVLGRTPPCSLAQQATLREPDGLSARASLTDRSALSGRPGDDHRASAQEPVRGCGVPPARSVVELEVVDAVQGHSFCSVGRSGAVEVANTQGVAEDASQLVLGGVAVSCGEDPFDVGGVQTESEEAQAGVSLDRLPR